MQENKKPQKARPETAKAILMRYVFIDVAFVLALIATAALQLN